jgi:hypothetical protein
MITTIRRGPLEKRRSTQPLGVMSRALMTLMAVALVGASSAADSMSESEALVRNLSKWSNLGIKSYTFQLHFTGHIPSVGPLPAARVQVRNGLVVDSRLLGPLGRLRAGSPAPLDPYVAQYFRMTVDELFAKAADSIEYARAHPSATLHITYDPKFGFPDNIDIEDPDTSDADGEYFVKEFEAAR